jgi:hypothetical protein
VAIGPRAERALPHVPRALRRHAYARRSEPGAPRPACHPYRNETLPLLAASSPRPAARDLPWKNVPETTLAPSAARGEPITQSTTRLTRLLVRTRCSNTSAYAAFVRQMPSARLIDPICICVAETGRRAEAEPHSMRPPQRATTTQTRRSTTWLVGSGARHARVRRLCARGASNTPLIHANRFEARSLRRIGAEMHE